MCACVRVCVRACECFDSLLLATSHVAFFATLSPPFLAWARHVDSVFMVRNNGGNINKPWAVAAVLGSVVSSIFVFYSTTHPVEVFAFP